MVNEANACHSAKMTWRQFRDCLDQEVLGGKPSLFGLRLLKALWSTNLGRQAVLRLRLAQLLTHYRCRYLAQRQLVRLAMRFGLYAEPTSAIGRGLRLPHPTSIVIGKGLRIGERCQLYQQVSIGAAPRDHDGLMPRIGDDVTVYPGAKFVGEGRVGDRVIVGANAVVTKPFGDDVVLAGIPARAIRRVGPGDRLGSVRT